MPTLEVDVITRGHLSKGLESLCDEFAGVFSAETIERFMAESLYAPTAGSTSAPPAAHPPTRSTATS